VTDQVARVREREEDELMVAPAPHQPTRTKLLRIPIRWPVSLERLYSALSLPPGFRKELTYGCLRIGRPDRPVDDALLDLADRLATEVPDIRFEVYAGWIVVSGTPRIPHNAAVYELTSLLFHISRERGWRQLQTVGVINRYTREYCIPDLVVAPRDAPEFNHALCGPGVLLVAEVTSEGTVKNDRGAKVTFYGGAGVPAYLLIDCELNEVVLQTRPHNEGYRDTVTVAIGKELELPEPFGISIDTGRLLA
jgi:Uma2 family endonuclease